MGLVYQTHKGVIHMAKYWKQKSKPVVETITQAFSKLYSHVKKKLTVPGQTQLRSSIHLVLYDDDLLTEILLRLPVISLLQFKSVSKQWLSLIKSPNFITFLNNQNHYIDPPFGLFLRHNVRGNFREADDFTQLDTKYDLVRFDSANRSPLHIAFPFGSNDDEGNVEILQSCNGLLLCIIRPFKLFVFNPSTNQFKLLPQYHYSKLKDINGIKLAFDPTKSHHYKVIYTETMYDNDGGYWIQIKTYSSETGYWSVYPNRFSYSKFSNFKNGIYCNGAIHWLDTNIRKFHYKLDMNHLVLTTIQNPQTVDEKLYFDHQLFEFCGCLLLTCVVHTYAYPNSYQHFNVYEKRNESSEWSVRYVISLRDVTSVVPRTQDVPFNSKFVRCVVLGEKEEESYLVMEVSRKIVQYNVVLKTVSMIYDLSPLAFRVQCFQFIPSLVGV